MKTLAASLLCLTLLGSGCSAPPLNRAVPLPEELLLLRQIEPAIETRHHDDIPPGTRLAIVPHHLVAMREIVSLLDSWPDPKPKRVFLISPDHFAQGKTAFTSLSEDYTYLDRRVSNDPDTVAALTQAVPSVTLWPDLLKREHGIDALIPLFDRTMPGAKIIPIAVRVDAKRDELDDLVAFLQKTLEDPDTAVIGSIDMSHYLPEEFADLHDANTIDAMKRTDFDASWKLEIDSPGSMYVILKLANELGLGDVRIQDHTNSLRIAQALVSDAGTSHILPTFSPGPIQTPRETHTVLFAPPGIPTEENRLYYGQDEIRPPLPTYPDLAITAIVHTDGTNDIGVVPLIKTDSGIQFMPREQRLNLIQTWKKDGTWDAIVRAVNTRL